MQQSPVPGQQAHPSAVLYQTRMHPALTLIGEGVLPYLFLLVALLLFLLSLTRLHALPLALICLCIICASGVSVFLRYAQWSHEILEFTGSTFIRRERKRPWMAAKMEEIPLSMIQEKGMEQTLLQRLFFRSTGNLRITVAARPPLIFHNIPRVRFLLENFLGGVSPGPPEVSLAQIALLLEQAAKKQDLTNYLLVSLLVKQQPRDLTLQTLKAKLAHEIERV
jgi:hypothetical protein